MEKLVKPLTDDRQNQEAKERIKDIIYLAYGKHMYDKQAEQVLNSYSNYINKEYISLQKYACIYYEQELQK